MDMNKQAKAKTTFDNIIIYVHEPTAPPSFLDLNLLKGKKLNCKLMCVTIIQSKNKNFNLTDGFLYRYPKLMSISDPVLRLTTIIIIPGFQK